MELASQVARAASWDGGPLHVVLLEPFMLVEGLTFSPLVALVVARVDWLELVIVWRDEAGPFHGVLEPLMYQPPVWVNRCH